MARYDEAFKLALVQQYLSGTLGIKRLAARSGVSCGQLKHWIVIYRERGTMKQARKQSVCTAGFKLAVLERMWAEQWSLRQTAVAFGIRHAGNVRKWECQYHEGGPRALEPKPPGRPRKMPTPKSFQPVPSQDEDTRTVQQLREENEYLRAEVAYLKKLRALLQAKEQSAQKKRG